MINPEPAMARDVVRGVATFQKKMIGRTPGFERVVKVRRH